MRKVLSKVLILGMLLIPSVLTYAQIGQNGEKMAVNQTQLLTNQQVSVTKSISSIFAEDFSSGQMPPTGWELIGDSQNWTNWPSNNAGGEAPECSFGWSPIFTGITKLLSPEISTSGSTNLVLEFQNYVWDFAGEGYTYSIQTTSDGGTTWNEVWAISPTGDIPAETVTIVIDNDDVGSDNFQFAICFDGSTTQINYWYTDSYVLSTEVGEAYTVTFNITDEDANPVENAQVNLGSAGTLPTNASGEAVFENTLPGEYSWWVMAEGLATEEGLVTVTDADVDVDVSMIVSTELLIERFGGYQLPEEWTAMGDGQANWKHSFSGFACDDYPELRFSSTSVFTGNSKYVSPEIVTVGYTDLFLEFDHFLSDSIGSGYSVKIETTSDGGATWNEAWSLSPTGDVGPEHKKILISTADVGSDDFQFALTFDGNSFNIKNWYIDNVILSVAIQYDAGITSMDIPSLLEPGVNMEPVVEVTNEGAQIITFDVTVEFADGANVYSETITVTDLNPMETESLSFPTWTATAGNYDGETFITLANDENPNNDVVGFNIGVASGLYPRKPIYEIFTSSTCPPCVYANEALDELLDENPGEYSLIKYQVNWPGSGDPYYTEEAGVRSGYYSVSSVPDLYVNAERFYPAMDITQADFDEFQNSETALQIDITKAEIDNVTNMVSIEADLISVVNYPAGLSAYMVVVEKVTYDNVGTNGETEFHNVMMKILPDAEGETLSELVTGVPTTITATYDMNQTFMETNTNLALVVFVQDNADKSVVQSEMMDVLLQTGIENNIASDEKIKLYPNPATDMLILESEIDVQKIELYNQVGQLVKIKNVNNNTLNLDISDLYSGVYFVKLFSQGSVTTKSVVVK